MFPFHQGTQPPLLSAAQTIVTFVKVTNSNKLLCVFSLQGTHPLLSAARAVAGGDRAAGCVWFADDSIMAPIWRCGV